MRRRFFRAAQGEAKGELELAAAGFNPAEAAGLLENAVNDLQTIAVGRERTALFRSRGGFGQRRAVAAAENEEIILGADIELHAACTAFSITFITSEARSGSDSGSEAGAAA